MKSHILFFVVTLFLYGCSNYEVYETGYEAAESDLQTLEADVGLDPETLRERYTGKTAEPTSKPVSTKTSKPVPTKTPKPVPTKTPDYPVHIADYSYNCREGPGTQYGFVAAIDKGTKHRIIARASNGWVAIAIDFNSTTWDSCWIGGGKYTGDLNSVEYVEVKPTAQASKNVPVYDLNSYSSHSIRGTIIGYLSCDDIAARKWVEVKCGNVPYNCRKSRELVNNAVVQPEEVLEICGFVPPWN